MKIRALFIFLFIVILVLRAPAQSREIFDALLKGDIKTIKTLVEKSPQILETRDGNGMTPLHHAAMGGSADLIDYFVDKGAKLELKNAQLKTALHLAAMNDRKDAAAVLIKRGAGLEMQDDYGRTALILCAREQGKEATGRLLIEAGADISAVDKFGASALDLAAWRGKREFVDLLLEKGAPVPGGGPKWMMMLSRAASQGLTTLFLRLTEKSQDLKAVVDPGNSLLHDAAAGGSAEIVGLLLDNGFDPSQPDRFGWTPLHYAALDGRSDSARILIDRGAPLDIRTIMGQTAYNVAQERGMQAVATLLTEKGADKSGIRFPVLEGGYLGQKPPADKAELFSLGIISSIWGIHSTAVFSPDGNEVYWAPMMMFPGEIYSRGGLLTMKRVKGRWTPPAWASFSGPDYDDDVPFFSPDGKKIYFISRRPLPGETQTGSEKIWFADRIPAGWSEPQPLDTSVNEYPMHWEFSLDREGNLYFSGQAPDSLGLQDIYLARSVNGKYEKPVNIGQPINSTDGENTPFIAPDGSYLLFERQYDLWVSFRAEDGAWSEPIKLGPEVNGPSIELCPIITADGKYLFFLSQRDGESHAYWVRADVIEKARKSTETANQEEPLILTRIANAGVLVRSKDSKVLIDALFDKPNPEYRAPDPEALAKIMKGEAPFDSIDLVLVTHNHPDHFDARLAVRYLETRPEPVLLAPSDAVEEMHKLAADWAKIESRIVSLGLKPGEKAAKDLKRISLTAFRTLHSGDQESPMNIMYLFELNSRRVFHEGDSTGNSEAYQGFGLGSTPVDLALVHYWFPLEPNCARFLQEALEPGHIALTHLPIRLENDAPGKIDQVRKYYNDIFLLLPGMPDKIFHKVK